LNLELKEDDLVGSCLTLLDRYENDVLFSSFAGDRLRTVTERSSVPTALLFGTDADTALAVASDIGCAAVHPFRRCCDAALVDTARGRGFDVNAWTVQSTAQADRLAGLGVDGLIADAPAFCQS
jgi:glycerophosphoryl diester phosphodiesterase